MDNAQKTQNGTERLKPYRFTSINQPKKNGRHKGSSPTDYLKKLSRVKINFQNPLTGKLDTAPVSLVVAIQLILKATQDSDLPSIKEFFERIDGKIPQKLEGEGFASESKIVIVTNGHTNNSETIPREIPLKQ
jgi:hypothetical protein